MLRLRLFGSPRLEKDGQPLALDTRKAIALLAYLGVTGEEHTRDALAALLWPELDQSHARAALRRTLSSLKAAVGEGLLETDKDNLRLSAKHEFQIDVLQFRRCMAVHREHGHPDRGVCEGCLPGLEAAAALYQGEFMSGFTLRDSPTFDDWQFLESERLRRDYALALEQLALAAEARGEYRPAIEHARRWLVLDSLNEAAHRALMRLYVLAGERNAALRQYRECVRVLDEELGVPPLEETAGLYHAILERRFPLPTAQGGTPPALRRAPAPEPHRARLPFVGRRQELEALLDLCAQSGQGGRLAVVEGEAGVGKTRLIEEFLQRLPPAEAVVIFEQCYPEAGHLPYAPLIQGLRKAIAPASGSQALQGVDEIWLAELSRLLPELAARLPIASRLPLLDAPHAQSRFLEGVAQGLFAILNSRPRGVLCFDNVHWADAASADALAYFARQMATHPVLLLLTWRSGDLSVGSPLRAMAAEAARGGHGVMLSLERLERHEVRELVRSAGVWEAPASEAFSDRLFHETEGLPFFLVEYLEMLPGRWAERAAENWPLPKGVRDLFAARLAQLNQAARQLITTAAVLGRSFDLDALQAGSGRSEDETVDGLETLLQAGLLRELDPDSPEAAPAYDFTHEKLREYVYEDTSLARRRLLHRRVAHALIVRGRGRGLDGLLASRIAHHLRLGGQEAEAAEYYRMAGERAAAVYANADALEHFRNALALGHPAAAELHEAIGRLHTLTGDYRAALASFETAAALAASQRLPHIERQAADVYLRLGDWQLAASYVQSAIRRLEEANAVWLRARLYTDWSRALYYGGEVAEARRCAQEALRLAQAANDSYGIAEAHNTLGMLAHHQEDLDGAVAHLESSLALAQGADSLAARAAALNNLALTLGERGERDRALALLEAALAACRTLGDRHREAALQNNLADLLHRMGREDDAMAHLKQAVALFAQIGVERGDWRPEIWKLVEW